MTLGDIAGMFSYPFVVRAMIVGVLVSLCASLLGVFLVLKRYSMIGHGLADVGFASLSLALALGMSPIYIATPILVIASFVIMATSQKYGVSGDLSIGVISTGSLAAGIIITSLSSGFNIDVYNYMFGSILSMNNSDVAVSIVLSLFVIGLYFLFYNKLFLIACDEDFASSRGVDPMVCRFLISLLTALTVAVGMRMMGTLLISSLIIFPSVTAGKISRSFRGLVIASGVISVSCFMLGMVVSFILNLPTGASVVAVNIIAMVLFQLISMRSSSSQVV